VTSLNLLLFTSSQWKQKRNQKTMRTDTRNNWKRSNYKWRSSTVGITPLGVHHSMSQNQEFKTGVEWNPSSSVTHISTESVFVDNSGIKSECWNVELNASAENGRRKLNEQTQATVELEHPTESRPKYRQYFCKISSRRSVMNMKV
jgi:hypothetical protein